MKFKNITIKQYFIFNAYLGVVTFIGMGIGSETLYKLNAAYLGFLIAWRATISQVLTLVATPFYGKLRLHVLILFSVLGDIILVIALLILYLKFNCTAVHLIFVAFNYHIFVYTLVRFEKQNLLRKVSDEEFKYIKQLEQVCYLAGGALGAFFAMFFHIGSEINFDIIPYMICIEITNVFLAVIQYKLASKIDY